MINFQTIRSVTLLTLAFSSTLYGQFPVDFTERDKIIEDVEARLESSTSIFLCRVHHNIEHTDYTILERWNKLDGPYLNRWLATFMKMYAYDFRQRPLPHTFLCVGFIRKDSAALFPVVNGRLQHQTLTSQYGPEMPLQEYKKLVLQVIANHSRG
jgi:hypothetical protein